MSLEVGELELAERLSECQTLFLDHFIANPLFLVSNVGDVAHNYSSFGNVGGVHKKGGVCIEQSIFSLSLFSVALPDK